MVVLIGLLLGLSVPATAADKTGDEADAPPSAEDQATTYPDISNDLTIGLLRTSGNTESQSLNVDLKTGIDYRYWQNTFELQAFTASEDGDETAERYSGRVQTDYLVSERTYLFGSGGYTRDHFGAYAKRSTLTAGVGRRIIDTDAMALKLQGGVGYRQSETQDSDETRESAIATARGEYEWQFSTTSEFNQVLEVEAGEDNTVTHSTSKLKSKLTQALALVLSYEIRHNSEVPDDREHTDTYTTVSLQYGF